MYVTIERSRKRERKGEKEERTKIRAKPEEQLSFATQITHRATKQIHIYSRKLSSVGLGRARIGARPNDNVHPSLGGGRRR